MKLEHLKFKTFLKKEKCVKLMNMYSSNGPENVRGVRIFVGDILY